MKRTFWAATGFTLGVGSSLYVQRRLRRAVQRYTPENLRHDLGNATNRVVNQTKEFITDLRDAAQEGTETMRQTEQELRAENDFGAQRHR
ncbi:MAG: hypothetical protein KTU85_03885 [Acidimicrobiia bacterium]|nr:hypothetical protein [Acidimicrobiia bacterium]MCY4456478.1 hypothetical protein [Acidimicrobiaceae bacterium]